MNDLDGKVAVITGGASGIGLAAAVLLARAGAAIVIADISDVQGEAAASEVAKGGHRAIFKRTDVSKRDECEALLESAIKTFGRVDIGFNNAGIAGTSAWTEAYDLANWQRVIDVNLTGVFNCMAVQLAAMRESGGGAIVNTASIMGLVGTAGGAAYCAAKHGVLGLTKVAAIEYAKYGIRVNAICPGFVDTPILGTGGARIPEQILDSKIMRAPMRRLASPSEVAELVVWLCSKHASFVTGASYVVDGGLLANS